MKNYNLFFVKHNLCFVIKLIDWMSIEVLWVCTLLALSEIDEGFWKAVKWKIFFFFFKLPENNISCFCRGNLVRSKCNSWINSKTTTISFKMKLIFGWNLSFIQNDVAQYISNFFLCILLFTVCCVLKTIKQQLKANDNLNGKVLFDKCDEIFIHTFECSQSMFILKALTVQDCVPQSKAVKLSI